MQESYSKPVDADIQKMQTQSSLARQSSQTLGP
jgi:hypothetical protein